MCGSIIVVAATGAVWLPRLPHGSGGLPEVHVFRVTGTAAGTASPLSTSGHVVAMRHAAVSVPQAARVVEVLAAEGADLEPGQAVIRLEHRELDARLTQALARLSTARAALARMRAETAIAERRAKRLQEFVERGAAAPVEAENGWDELTIKQRTIEEARSQAREAAASSRVYKAMIAATQLRSPMRGRLISTPPHVGDVFGPGQTISELRIVDLQSLALETEIPEANLDDVTLGTRAKIHLDALPGKAFEGRVVHRDSQVNRAKATVGLRVAFEGPADGVLPNMAARLSFPRSRHTPDSLGTRVPAATLVNREGETGILVVEGDVLHTRRVSPTAELGADVQLSESLPAGTRIVLSPSTALEEGRRVRVVDAAGDSP